MECILIAGGTGMIGTALIQELMLNGYDVIVLSRHSAPQNRVGSSLTYASWDIKTQTIDQSAIQKADHIIHLAGAGIADKRWTKKRKQEILESRTSTSRLLVKALRECPNKVKTIVSASAIGWYGQDPVVRKPAGFVETDPAASDFLGLTCKKWEESIDKALSLGIRVVTLRTGIVLSSTGGALKEFKKPLKFGIAPILGNGKQIISWISINDLVRIYIHALQNERMKGVFNAVAPSPVSNKEFILTLAKTRRGSFYIPVKVPAFTLKIILGEMAIEVLKSATVNCDKIQNTGFTFQFPTVKATLENLLFISRIKANYTN